MSELNIHSDEHFMQLALQQAEKALAEKEIPVGAVVVANQRVIAKAYNQVEKLNDCTAHAEILAITAAQNYLGSKYLDQCTLFVTLEPCVMCAGALYWAQIHKLVMGASDPKRGYRQIASPLLHPTTEVRSGLMNTDSERLIKSFFNNLRGNNSL